MAKDINRSAYTQRILEIVSNIRKQNQDIDKVIVTAVVVFCTSGKVNMSVT